MRTTDIQKNQKYRIALFIVDALDLEDNGAGAPKHSRYSEIKSLVVIIH